VPLCGGRPPQLFDQQEGVAVHRLRVVFEDLYGEAVLADGGVDVHAHGLRGGPGQVGALALPSCPSALLTDTAGVHEEQEGFVVAGEEDLPLQLQKALVDLPGPGVAIFGILQAGLEVKGGRRAVLSEELAALLD
jgi:hypothetical protein